MKHSIESRDPADLRPGHILKDIPHHQGDEQAFNALCDSILERGALADPVKITAHGQIVDLDSLDRWRAAKQAQLDSIPCQIVHENEVATTFLQSLVLRRHYTKSQLAFLTYPLMKAAHEEAIARRFEKLKNSNVSSLPMPSATGKTVSDLAANVGISVDLFQFAAKVHEAFAKDTTKHDFTLEDGTVSELTLKEYFEPRILRTCRGGEHSERAPMGLGAVIAGIAGLRDAEKRGLTRVDRAPEQLFLNGFQSIVTRLGKLPDMGNLRPILIEAVHDLPDDELARLETFAEELQREIKTRRKAIAKGNGL